MGKKTKRISLIILALVGLSLATTTPVMAADPTTPATFQIVSAQACRNVVVPGDEVIAFIYNISDQTYTKDVNQYFQFRLLDTDATTLLGACTPFAYNAAGYDMGYSAFYFASGGPAWNSGININISGSPVYWATPPTINYTMAAAEYESSTNQAVNQAKLATFLIGATNTIQLDWGVQMVEQSGSYTILTAIGATYATGTIPGIRNMAPGMFASQNPNVDTSRKNWGTAGSDAYLNQWPGTKVAEFMAWGGDLFGGNVIAFMTVMAMLGILILYGLANRVWNDTRAVPSMAIVVLTSSFMQGGLSRGPFFIIVAIAAIFLMFCLMLRNAN